MNNVVSLNPEPDKFDEFWKHCAKKIGKPLCRVKWDAITGDGLKTKTLDKDSGTFVEINLQATPEELIKGMKKYNEQQTDPQTYKLREYTCMTSTWLNQGRWMDGE